MATQTPVTHMIKIALDGTPTHKPLCANKAAWSPILTDDPLKVTCKKCIMIRVKK